MPAPRGVRTQRIQDARESYFRALQNWLADPEREHEGERPSSELLAAASLELVDALREAGVEGGHPQPRRIRFVD